MKKGICVIMCAAFLTGSGVSANDDFVVGAAAKLGPMRIRPLEGSPSILNCGRERRFRGKAVAHGHHSRARLLR